MQLPKGTCLDAYGRMRAIRALPENQRQLSEGCLVGVGLHLGPRDLVCAPTNDQALTLAARMDAETYDAATPARVLGAAIARRAGAPQSATVCVLDGEMPAGRLTEALRAAVSLSLPILFVGPRDGAGLSGLPRLTVEGHDFFAVHEAANEAFARARAGRGPSLLEATGRGKDALDAFRREALRRRLLSEDEFAYAEGRTVSAWSRPAVEARS